MTIHDDAQAAGRQVIDAELARLRGLIDAGTKLFDDEKAAHAVTRGTLGDAAASIATLRARVAELESAPTAPPVPEYGPISFKTVQEAAKFYGLPADAKLVQWRWADDVTLEQAFTEMQAEEILVLAERDKPYLLDTSEGFRASGVVKLLNGATEIPWVNKFRGGNSRTWFAFARARKGILGMGPGARIEFTQSGWRMPQQAAQGQLRYVNTKGETKTLSDSAMRLIETESQSSFYANFTIIGRDLGGVAYNAIGSHGGGVAKRINFVDAFRGFLNAPNGETGALTFNGPYLVENIELNGRDSKTGKRIGTTPIMINSSPGGTVRNIYVHETYAGAAMSIWNSRGKHVAENFRSEFASGVNLEANHEGFEFEWNGGTDYVDYQRRGEWPAIPDGNYKNNSSLHLNMRSPYGSQKVTLRGVDIDKGPQPGYVSVQSYSAEGEARKQLAADVNVFDRNGNRIPVKFYGAIAAGA